MRNHENNWQNHILRTDSSRLTQKLRVTNHTDEEMLDDRDDGGMIVYRTKRANKLYLEIDEDDDAVQESF
jgi:hypothetical protein